MVNEKQLVLNSSLIIHHFEQSRQPVGHPRLRPAHVGRAHGAEASLLVVEEAARVAQLAQRPGGDAVRKLRRVRLAPAQLRERGEGGAGGMCVGRVRAAMVVFRPAVRKKEALAPEAVAALQSTLYLFARR